MKSLVDAFIDQEGAHACQLILEAVREQEKNPARVKETFEFNTFDVTLLFPERIAVLEDVIAFWQEGTLRIDLDTFVRRLRDVILSTGNPVRED